MIDTAPLILVVDDEKQTSHTIAMGLETAGYRTMEAATTAEGLQAAREQRPQLIILDYQLGNQDGVTMLRELRSDDWGRQVPVIIASNVYDVDIINDIMALGVQDYVLKVDINLDGIIELVRKYVPVPLPPQQV